ncbi:hypothetical protein ABXV18_24950 [Vibrio owensii]|uniref:hypothetical protein n=1 Tax=Vibrio owensii TaxID=696485 RepID=UPI00339B3FF4
MDNVFQKGENIVLQIPLATEAELGSPLMSATYSVYDMNNTVVLEDEPVDIDNIIGSDFGEDLLLVIPALNPEDMPVIDGVPRAFYRTLVEFKAESGMVHRHTVEFFLEDKLVDLEPPKNSFVTYGYLMSLAGSMSNVDCIVNATFEERMNAFMQAYRELETVPLFVRRGNDKKPVIPEFKKNVDFLTTDELRDMALGQLLQANYILGGSPIEERRKSGLVSGSTGSSSNFYRGDKPLAIPVGNEALDALKRYISWQVRISR